MSAINFPKTNGMANDEDDEDPQYLKTRIFAKWMLLVFTYVAQVWASTNNNTDEIAKSTENYTYHKFKIENEVSGWEV